MNKIKVFMAQSSEVYRKNTKIIILMALLSTALNTIFHILGENSSGISGLIITLLEIVMTAPLLICSYNVYYRCIKGEETNLDYVFSWITNGVRIEQGVRIEVKLIIKAIKWYVIYAVICVASIILGPLMGLGIVAGAIFLAYMLLRYDGALYECAGNPDLDVNQMIDFGIEKLNVRMSDYISLWLKMVLPFTIVVAVIEFALSNAFLAIIASALVEMFIMPKFRIAGIMLHNDTINDSVDKLTEEFPM